MALKLKIDKTAYEALSADVKKEYKAKGADYILDTEGDDDAVSQLRTALEQQRQEAKQAKKERDELKAAQDAEREAAELETRRKAGNFDAIENDYKSKLAAKDNEIKTAKDGYTTKMRQILVGSAATALAAKISTSPDLIRPFIEQRLTADMDADTPITRVLNAKGEPSAMTVEDLGKELAADARFKSIIIAGRGTGGGGAPIGQRPGGGGGGALSRSNNDKPVDLSKLTPKELVAHMRDVKANSGADSGGEGDAT